MKLLAKMLLAALCVTAVAVYSTQDEDYIEDRSNTLAGVDSNNDGVRDDIGLFINSLELSDIEHEAIMLLASNQQKIYTFDTKNKKNVWDHAQDRLNITSCIANHIDVDKFLEIGNAIETKTRNTNIRNNHYQQYRTTASGSSQKLYTNTCAKYGMPSS